jgi:hypothetical protein
MGLASLLCLGVSSLHGFVIIDDAYISYRYARNLLLGHGLVFNAGERVEGITNLLWTLLMTAGLQLGFQANTISIWLGLTFALLAVYELWRCCLLLGATPLQSGIAVTAASMQPYYWLTAANGLEAGLVAFLVIKIVRCFLSDRPVAAGVFGGALFATRPDTLGVFPLAAAWWLWTTKPAEWWKKKSSVGEGLKVASAWAVCVAALTAWRFLYYGDWLPNTIQAKLPPPGIGSAQIAKNARDGIAYIARFGLAIPLHVAAVLGGLLFSPARRTLWLVIGLPALLVPAILTNGGDWVPHQRLLMPYLPVLSIAVALAAKATAQPAGIRYAASIVSPLLLAPLMSSVIADPGWRWRPHLTQELDPPCWSEVGERLATVLRPDDRVAVEVLGVIGYLNRQAYVHDLLSLTDRVGAARGEFYMPRIGKFDPDRTMELRPTILVFGAGSFFLPPLRTATSGSFDADYRTSVTTVRGRDCSGRKLYFSVRADSLDRIAPAFQDLHSEPVPRP